MGDCDSLIRGIPDGIVDSIIDDPPFGVAVANGWKPSRGKVQHHMQDWDKPLNWDTLFPEMWRVLNPAGTIVIASMQPLTAELVHAQRDGYLYSWYWIRGARNPYAPKYGRPHSYVEEIPVFSHADYKERTYNPPKVPLERPRERVASVLPFHTEPIKSARRLVTYERHPTNLLFADWTEYDKPPRIQWGQKPVDLMRQLIRIHTNKGDLVLDVSAGGMTTAIACILEGRRFICFEKYRPHYALGVRRVHRLLKSL